MLGERRFVDGKSVREGKGQVLIAGAAREQMGGKTGSLLQTPGCDLFGQGGDPRPGQELFKCYVTTSPVHWSFLHPHFTGQISTTQSQRTSRCRVLSYVKNACTMEPCFSHAKASRGRHRTMAIEPYLLFLVNRCFLSFRNRIVFSDHQMEARLW